MQRVHNELEHYKGEKDPLKLIAAKFAREARVICFDEFFRRHGPAPAVVRAATRAARHVIHDGSLTEPGVAQVSLRTCCVGAGTVGGTVAPEHAPRSARQDSRVRVGAVYHGDRCTSSDSGCRLLVVCPVCNE